MTIEVTVKMTTWMTFERGETDPFQAARAAVRAVEDGDQPDEYPMMPDIEIEEIKVGDREIRLDYHLDFHGPKDEHGMYRYRVIAREGSEVVAQGFSLEDVLTAAVDAGGDE